MENAEKNQNKFLKWLRTSISLRMIIVGILTLILLIPLSFIESLIEEREHRKAEVVESINEKWGEEVLIYGPILKVPYKTYIEVVKVNSETKEKYTERREELHTAYFFPKQLDAQSSLNPEVKKYGIYNSVVYKGDFKAQGFFGTLDFASENIPEEDVLWDRAKVIIQTSNLKGISNKVKISVNGKSTAFKPQYLKRKQKYEALKLEQLESDFIMKGQNEAFDKLNFKFQIDFNGSEQLRMIPIGEETNYSINSHWSSPSFVGNYLPYNEDKISDDGFDAKWKVLNINRAFSQSFFDHLPNLNEFAFGVNLMLPVDEYQQSTRSAKYGFLVIALTFLVFFMFQTISKINIHPFQYLMIGLALTMFYTLLISISEHSNFSIAYLISCFAVVGLIALYSKSILNSYKFSLFIAFALAVLYAFIYIIIQMESYALLTGSIGLFVILAIVMYASKKIEWNGDLGEAPEKSSLE